MDEKLSHDDLLKQLVLAQATDLARAGRYAEAEKLLTENMRNLEAMPAALDLLARMYAQQGRLGEARLFWIRALRLDPTNEAYVAGLLRIREYQSSRWSKLARLFSPRASLVSSSSSGDGVLMARHKGNKWRYELVRKQLVRNPIAGGGHDYLVYRLVLLLGSYIEADQLGVITLSQAGYEVTLLGEHKTVLVPDLAFVRADRVPVGYSPEWTRPWKLAPDLVVEVISPDQSHQEIDQRAYSWLERGVRLVWMIWPASKTVDVWLPGSSKPMATLGVGETLDGLDVVPGFTCPLVHIFGSARASTQ